MSLDLNNISFSYEGEKSEVIFEDVSFSVCKGEVLAIMGLSGSGKSTLLKLITSFLKQDAGIISLNNAALDDKKPYTQFGYICQGASDMTYPWLRVEDNLLKPLKRRGQLKPDTKRYAAELLRRFRLTNRKHAYPYALSGGEIKRLSVAMALVYKPDVLLLDEPFSGLDPKLTKELWEFMLTYLDEVKPTGILITHNIDEASLLANKVGFLLPNKKISICPVERSQFVQNATMEKFYSGEFEDYQKYLANEFNNHFENEAQGQIK